MIASLPLTVRRAPRQASARWRAHLVTWLGVGLSLTAPACMSDAVTTPSPKGAGEREASAEAAATQPLAIVPPIPGDAPLEEADQAHVAEIAALSDGGVAAIVTRRDGFGGFALGGGALFNDAALVVFDATGTLRWQRRLRASGASGVTRLLALPDGGLLAADGTRLSQFSAEGNELRTESIEGAIDDLARLPGGQVVELIHLQAEGAARYRVPRPGYYLLEVFTHRVINDSLGAAPDLVTSRLAIDGKGIGWTSSHRIGQDLTPVSTGIPSWWRVTGAASGGAYVTFSIGIRGCPTWCGSTVKALGEGTYRARLDADGTILDLRDGANSDELMVESVGSSAELWTTRPVVVGRNYALALGLEGAQKMIASTGHVAPTSLAPARSGVWVGGGFSGQLRARGVTLDAGTTQGHPLLLRVPNRAALAEFGK